MTQLGKYGTDRDNILHYMATSDWANDSFGDVEAPTGYVWRISNTLSEVQVSNTELTSLIEDQLEAYNIEDGPAFRASLVGHFVIEEDSNGFVSVTEFESEAVMLEEFENWRKVFEEWDSQEDEA
jgi:hypothetical protein